MKKKKKTTKKKLNQNKLYISIALTILNVISICLFSYSVILYNEVETFYRIFGLLLLIYFLILNSYLNIRNSHKRQNKPFIITAIITGIFIIIELIGSFK
jgi:hypothetical protein